MTIGLNKVSAEPVQSSHIVSGSRKQPGGQPPGCSFLQGYNQPTNTPDHRACADAVQDANEQFSERNHGVLHPKYVAEIIAAHFPESETDLAERVKELEEILGRGVRLYETYGLQANPSAGTEPGRWANDASGALIKGAK